MMDLKGLLADQMGYFTPYDVPGILLSMLLAALIAFLLGLLAGGAEGPGARALGALAAVTALAISLVRASVPLSIALVAVVLILRGEVKEKNWRSFILNLAALTVGVGCGSSAGLVVLAVFIPLGLLLRWALNPRN
jgi:hypothetical protein